MLRPLLIAGAALVFFTIYIIFHPGIFTSSNQITSGFTRPCCSVLNKTFIARSSPPVGSLSYNWSQQSILDPYVDNSLCAHDGMFDCRISSKQNKAQVHIQFLNDLNNIVYEDGHFDRLLISVQCNENRQWIVNDKLFSKVTCSQL